MVVDAGESQVLEGRVLREFEPTALRLGRVEAAVAHGVEQRAEGGEGPGGAIFLILQGFRLTPPRAGPYNDGSCRSRDSHIYDGARER